MGMHTYGHKYSHDVHFQYGRYLAIPKVPALENQPSIRKKDVKDAITLRYKDHCGVVCMTNVAVATVPCQTGKG